MSKIKRWTFQDRPDLIEAADAVIPAEWPEFMLNDQAANRYWHRLYEEFADFQFVLLDEAQRIAAVGNSLPVVWDGTVAGLPDRGWDAALEGGFDARRQGQVATTLSALSVTVPASHQGQGVSREVILAMRSMAAEHGLDSMIAPVRPSLKSRYPLIPMERYARWAREDGAPFDPWLRTHWRLGGRFMKVAPQSMLVEAPVARWEEWTGMLFPESGEYVVPGGLNPVQIDGQAGAGLYVEPNVWMCHGLEDERELNYSEGVVS
jgi:GNAT superfamily N-acetyltransferase